MKESCMQEHLCKHFHTEGYKSFLGEASVTFIEGKKMKKRERYWMRTLKTMKHYGLNQARNQEFFRAGEVSENKGTSINI